MPQVDLSFINQGVNVIFTELLNLAIIVGVIFVALFIILKITRVPKWLADRILIIVPIGLFVLLIFKTYLPNIATQLGLIF